MLKSIPSPDSSSVILALGRWDIWQFAGCFFGEAPRLITEDGSVYEFGIFRRRSEVYGQWNDGKMTPKKRLTTEEVEWLRDTDFSLMSEEKFERIRQMFV